MNAAPIHREITFGDNNHACALYGDLNKNLQSLEKSTVLQSMPGVRTCGSLEQPMM
jgi:hypothetical protein